MIADKIKIVFLLVFLSYLFVSCCKENIEYYSDSEGGGVKYVYYTQWPTKEKCGPLVWFSRNGDTLKHASYTNNKLNGPYRSFYNNGNVETTAEMKNDMFHGDMTFFYENGQLWFNVRFKENKLWSIMHVYDTSGNEKDFGDLLNGNGSVKTYYPSGELEEEGQFVNGLRQGYWMYYSNNGLLLDSILYTDGVSETGTAKYLY